MRTAVTRTARVAPHLTVLQIAARLRCHPSTVSKHLPRRIPPRSVRSAQVVADPDPQIRATLAASSLCPPAALARLAADAEYSVRAVVADHPNGPPGSLSRLAGDPIWDVPATVASNGNCPPATLNRLCGYTDDDGAVRYAAARHRNCPPAALRRLLNDEDPAIRHAAARLVHAAAGS